MDKYLDYKVTLWNRIKIPDNISIEEVIEELKDTDANCLPFVIDEGVLALFDTEEIVPLEENNGNPTIEIYDNDRLVWDNGTKPKEVDKQLSLNI